MDLLFSPTTSILVSPMCTNEVLLDILQDTEDVDYSDSASVLFGLFDGTVQPDIFLTFANKVALQQIFIVKMGGGGKILKLLQQPETLFSLPVQLQMGIFDLLYVVLRRGTYDVVKFQYNLEEVGSIDSKQETQQHSQSMTSILLDLVHSTEATLPVSERIVRLLGLTFAAGCTADELKEVLYLLRAPTVLTIPLLKTVKMILKHDSGITKASPPSFFTFGGSTSGLYSVFGTFPFSREYQIFTWFRVDKFESASSSGRSAVLPTSTETHDSSVPSSSSSSSSSSSHTHRLKHNGSHRQHIVSVVDSSYHGVDIYLEHNALTISISDAKSPPTIIVFDAKDLRLTRGVWYHLAVRHVKPRLSLFSKDELSIYLDNHLVFQDNVRFPNASHIGSTSLVCGRNFNGQIGPIYFLAESLPPAVVEAMSRLDAGKGHENCNPGSHGYASTSSNSASSSTVSAAADLLPTLTTADRKSTVVQQKFTSVFQPSRCAYGHALDIHGGRHAMVSHPSFTLYPLNNRSTAHTPMIRLNPTHTPYQHTLSTHHVTHPIRLVR